MKPEILSQPQKEPQNPPENDWDSLATTPFAKVPAGESSDPTEEFSYTDTILNGEPFEDWERSEVSPDAFSDFYSLKEIASDANYVLETRKKLHINPTEKKLSKDFEKMFVAGIGQGNWLGGYDVGKDHSRITNFDLDARQGAEYDDYRHRIDAFATLYFANPVEGDDEVITDRAILGFDVSINADPEKIKDKFLRHYNDSKNLPFGFSSIKYYADDEFHGSANLVPHYIIGLSDYDVRRILDYSPKRPDGEVRSYNLNTREGIIDRFKILSEIRAENLLYDAMLPDDRESPIVKQASAMLSATDEVLNNARRLCVNELIEREFLPTKIRAKLKTARESAWPGIVEEYLLEESAATYEKVFAARERRHWERILNDPTYYKDPPERTADTFCQIITICSALQKQALAGTLDDRRKIMPHNRKFTPETLSDDALDS